MNDTLDEELKERAQGALQEATQSERQRQIEKQGSQILAQAKAYAQKHNLDPEVLLRTAVENKTYDFDLIRESLTGEADEAPEITQQLSKVIETPDEVQVENAQTELNLVDAPEPGMENVNDGNVLAKLSEAMGGNDEF